MHICGGSFQSTCMAEDFILEYDGRSDGFEPPRAVLKDEFSALGFVSTERPALEPKDAFKRCVDAAEKYVPLEYRCRRPRCGFAGSTTATTWRLISSGGNWPWLSEVAAEV